MANEIKVSEMCQEYLRSNGIEVKYDINVVNEKDGFRRIDDTLAGRLNGLLAQLPHMVAENYGGEAYKVIFDRGLGTLQESAQHPGYLLGNVVGKANNDIKDVALLQRLSSAPQIVSGIFSVMSIVTGQYYMSQINDKLEKLEKGVASIEQFIENDKKSRLQGNLMFLRSIQSDLRYIKLDGTHKQATITNIQQIEREAVSDILFYQMQINDLKNLSFEKDKAVDVVENIEKAYSNLSGYWCALYLYCYAAYEKIIVLDETDEAYIESVKSNLIGKCEDYKNNLEQWNMKIESYIAEAKGLGKNKALEAAKVLRVAKFSPILWAVGEAANLAYNADVEKKAEMKEKAEETYNLIRSGENIRDMESLMDEMDLYGKIYNSRIELLHNEDGLFIKMDEKLSA